MLPPRITDHRNPVPTALRAMKGTDERTSAFPEQLFASIDIAPLVWFRVVFGGLMLTEVARYLAYGWVDRYFVAPSFLFKYYGFEWVTPWPGHGMTIHFIILGVLACGIITGAFYRFCAPLFFIGFTYVFLLDQARYLNHFYLVCLYSFLLAVVPAHRAFSIDSWRRPNLRLDIAPAWSLWILRAQIGFVYLFGGIAKLNSDWLRGEPVRSWLARRADYPLVGPWLEQEAAVWLLAYGGLIFDLMIVPLLLWRRTRAAAFALAIGFNFINALLFQLGIFPWLTLAATLLLFSERVPRPWQDALSSPLRPAAPASRRHRTWIVALLTAWSFLQIVVPLRHWLYPGDVMWTEEGHRFSWRMMLRQKEGTLQLHAHDPDRDATWTVPLESYITPRQRAEAARRPDMILQLGHEVANRLRERGHPRIEIRAESLVSLNGRPPQLLVDPRVDLAAQSRSLMPANWIMPLGL